MGNRSLISSSYLLLKRLMKGKISIWFCKKDNGKPKFIIVFGSINEKKMFGLYSKQIKRKTKVTGASQIRVRIGFW